MKRAQNRQKRDLKILYPVRELLGISQADERLIYNTVLGRIAEAVR